MVDNLKEAYKNYIKAPSPQTGSDFADALFNATYDVGYFNDSLIVESADGYDPRSHVYVHDGNNMAGRPSVLRTDPRYSEKSLSFNALLRLMIDEGLEEIQLHGIDVFPIGLSVRYLIGLFDSAYGTTYEDVFKDDFNQSDLTALVGSGVSAISAIKARNPKYGTIVFPVIIPLDDVDYRQDFRLYQSLMKHLNKLFANQADYLECAIPNSADELTTDYFKKTLKESNLKSFTTHTLIDERITNKYLGIHEVKV